MADLRIAVIGVGLIGELHARIFAADPRCTLVAVCDTDRARADAVAAETSSRAYDSHAALLADNELDAVSIATPEAARAAPACAAADLGLRLLLEKPLGRSLATVDELVAAMRQRHNAPMVNFILHADPRYARMERMVKAGEIGRIVSFFARRRGSRLGLEKYARWTDLLSSTLIHDIEMVLAVNPAPPARVFAEAVIRECAPYGSHDAVVATLRFADGAIACFETSWVMPPGQPEPLEPVFHVVGDAGAVMIEGASNGMRTLTGAGFTHPDMVHWPVDDGVVGGALAASLHAFVTSVINDTPPPVGLDQARAAELVVDAMKRSIASGLPVDLDAAGSVK
jgi:predicted dehydrogenase